jgi:hypothetical protein
MKHRIFFGKDFASFEFVPQDDEILGGFRSAYVDVTGRLHICFDYEKNLSKKGRAMKKNQKDVQRLIAALAVKP